MTNRICITMNEAMHDKAKDYCKKTGRTLSGLVQCMLREKFDEEWRNEQ